MQINLQVLKKIFSDLKSGSDSTKTTRPSLSVNSLSKISDQFGKFAQGENIRKTSFALCFILCAWFIADIFALLFEKHLPSPPVSALSLRSKSSAMANPMDYQVIATRNLFSSKSVVKKSRGDEIDMEADPVPTSLPFQLIGTVIFQDPTRSLAAIQDKGENKVYPVRMGDEIEGQAQILSVEARKVIFINTQARRKEFIEIPDDPSVKISMNTAPKAGGNITQVEENRFVIKRSEVEAQLANFNTLITQARAVPEMEGGNMIGFRLMQIQPGSFYEKIGLNVGDIITSVNGEKMTDAAKALSVMQDLKNMNGLDLGLKRNGKGVNLNYDIQ